MAQGDCAQGAQARLVLKTGSPPYTWTGGESMEFIEEDVKLVGSLGVPNAIRGTREEASERARRGPYKIGGPFTVSPSPWVFSKLLERALGGTPVGTTYGLAESVPAFGALFDKVTEQFAYHNCRINRFILSGQASEDQESPMFLRLAVEVFAMDQDTTSTFPADWLLVTEASNDPYTFDDCTLTIGGVEYEMDSFTLLINNHLRERRTNNLKPTAVCPSRRTVALRTVHPFDVTTLINIAAAGVTGSLAMENEGGSTTFTFGRLQAPPIDPVVPGKTEIKNLFNAAARKVGSTPSLSVTNIIA